jgi:hypothetical protein
MCAHIEIIHDVSALMAHVLTIALYYADCTPSRLVLFLTVQTFSATRTRNALR